MGAIARDTQLSQTRAKEKKTAAAAGVSRARCYRRAFKNRTRRKVGVGSVRSQYAKARVPGRPSTRPEQECVPSASSYALCVAPPRARPSRAAGGGVAPSLSRGPAPHASHGRPRFPAVRSKPQHGRTSAKLLVPAPNSNCHGIALSMSQTWAEIIQFVPFMIHQRAQWTDCNWYYLGEYLLFHIFFFIPDNSTSRWNSIIYIPGNLTELSAQCFTVNKSLNTKLILQLKLLGIG